jgi:hypothetical protein
LPIITAGSTLSGMDMNEYADMVTIDIAAPQTELA